MATQEQIAELFTNMKDNFQPGKAEGVDAVIQFDLEGEGGGQYWVKVADGTCDVGEGAADNPRMTVKTTADMWWEIANGRVNVMQAFMGGKLKVQGDMNLGMKMQGMFGMV